MKIQFILLFALFFSLAFNAQSGRGKKKNRHKKEKISSNECRDKFLLTNKKLPLREQYMHLIMKKVDTINVPAYDIQWDDFYFVGEKGQKHERRAARSLTRWLEDSTRVNYLHIPSLNYIDVPGLDGALFNDNPIFPKARMTLKSIFSIDGNLSLEQKVEEVVVGAMRQANKFSDFSTNKNKSFEKYFNHIVRRQDDEVLRKWLKGNAPYLEIEATNMALLGFKLKKPPPLVVVVTLEKKYEKNQITKVITSLNEKLNTMKPKSLHGILLINQGEVFEIGRKGNSVKDL